MQIINWTEKPGLYRAITDAGYYVEHTHAGSYADNAEAVQAIIDSYDPLPYLKTQLHTEIAQLRSDKQKAGMPYTFPDGIAGTIQLRDDQDVGNVTGRVTAAIILQSQNVTEAVLSFRDEQNITHAMSPAQVIEMGMAVSSYIESTYKAKWEHDSTIADWDGTTEYDLTQYWPE